MEFAQVSLDRRNEHSECHGCFRCYIILFAIIVIIISSIIITTVPIIMSDLSQYQSHLDLRRITNHRKLTAVERCLQKRNQTKAPFSFPARCLRGAQEILCRFPMRLRRLGIANYSSIHSSELVKSPATDSRGHIESSA